MSNCGIGRTYGDAVARKRRPAYLEPRYQRGDRRASSAPGGALGRTTQLRGYGRVRHPLAFPPLETPRRGDETNLGRSEPAHPPPKRVRLRDRSALVNGGLRPKRLRQIADERSRVAELGPPPSLVSGSTGMMLPVFVPFCAAINPPGARLCAGETVRQEGPERLSCHPLPGHAVHDAAEAFRRPVAGSRRNYAPDILPATRMDRPLRDSGRFDVRWLPSGPREMCCGLLDARLFAFHFMASLPFGVVPRPTYCKPTGG